MDEYQALANAIVLQAVTDYRKVLLINKKHPYRRDYESEMRSIEQFFHSGWFASLTDVNPKMLISKLKAEVASL